MMVGVSLTQQAVRLLSLTFSKSVPTIENISVTSISSDWQSLSKSIRQVVQEISCEQCDAAIALPFSQIIYKKISLPSYLTESECHADITNNASYHFPGVTDPLYIDHVLLNSGNEKNKEYLLVAARMDSVTSYVDLMEQAGLQVRIIDVDMYALVRGVCAFKEMIHVRDKLIVNIENQLLTVILLKNTDIIAHQQCAINMDEDGSTLFHALQGIIKRLPLTSSLDQAPPLFLTGQFYHFDTLKNRLKKELQLSVDVANPFHSIASSSAVNRETLLHHAPELLVSYGLALRGMPDAEY